jgi:hypothetical protein
MDKAHKNLQMGIFTRDSTLVENQMDTESTIGETVATSKEVSEMV